MRGVGLTAEQKQIVRDNCTRWETEISKLPGMEGTTARQIHEYLKRQEKIPDDTAQVVEVLESYISTHGLPRRFGVLVEYIAYLKNT